MKSISRPLLLIFSALIVSSPALGDDPLDRANPQMRAVLEQLDFLGPKPIEELAPRDARHQPTAADAVLQLLQTQGVLAPDRLPAVGAVKTLAISGPDGDPLRLRVYTPPGHGPFPVVVYLHGGGWVIATLDTYDGSSRAICSLTEAVVVSVDYRRAPEHPFPAAPEDSYAAFQYVVEHASEFDGDASRVAIAGESAGGNLATVVSLMAAARQGHMPVHQALIYPITNDAFDTESYEVNADAKPLNRPMMQYFFDHYLEDPADGDNIFVSPLRATLDQLSELPPTTIVTAEIDPLRDDGRSYADKLTSAGVPVRTKDYPGVTHEFFGMGLVVDKALDAERFVAGELRAALSE
ncbi:MAG TPA: alpha/beta hydrolase [Polyangiaceae bacterium]|nr:alpha/beta hydrolase [Polyangiaceae bacterium]